MRKMDWYFDHYGLLVVKPWPEPWTYDNGDAGDCAHNTGFNRFLRYCKFKNDPDQLNREQNKFAQELDMLEDPKKRNNYRRHPDETYWYSRSNNFSRDQQRPLVMAMGALKQKKRLFGLIWEQVKRFGLYQNNRHPDETRGWKMPDVPAPNHIGEYIRAIYMLGGVFKLIAVLYPVLVVCDMCGFIGTLFARKDWVNPNEADDDNRIMATIQAQLALPTPNSYRDWETDRKSTRLNSSHSRASRMPSSA